MIAWGIVCLPCPRSWYSIHPVDKAVLKLEQVTKYSILASAINLAQIAVIFSSSIVIVPTQSYDNMIFNFLDNGVL